MNNFGFADTSIGRMNSMVREIEELRKRIKELEVRVKVLEKTHGYRKFPVEDLEYD